MMRKERKPIFANETTKKFIAPNLTRLSKLLAHEILIYKNAIKHISEIQRSADTGVYYVYINLDNDKLDAILEQITPYAQEVRF
jgi:hypothetical protein